MQAVLVSTLTIIYKALLLGSRRLSNTFRNVRLGNLANYY
jgi:hypothetical protein